MVGSLQKASSAVHSERTPTSSTRRGAAHSINPNQPSDAASQQDCTSSTAVQDDDEGDNVAAYMDAMNDRPIEQEQAAVPLYLGEPHLLSFVMDVCNSGHQSHYLVPRAAARTLPSDDLTFLRVKGCFSLPSPKVCECLLKHYFHYVHPLLPIVDANRVLTQYHHEGDAPCVNLLLLWSMFFAAANFASPELVQDAKYASRKAMKRDLYQRAKSANFRGALIQLLYDSDYETDKIVVIQAALLLSYWFIDSEDRTGTYHWIGIAISLCHTIGLHQDTQRPSLKTATLPNAQHALWRSIWWSCLCRETWISFGMGRPMRIMMENCNVPMPTLEDVMLLYGNDTTPGRESLMPQEVPSLALCWLKMLNTTVALYNIHRTHYGPNRAKSSTVDIARDQEMLLNCAQMPSASGTSQSMHQPLRLVQQQLELIEHFISIALYRLYIHKAPSDLSPEQYELWRPTIMEKVYASASAASTVLVTLGQASLIDRCQSIIITAIIPIMQIHLYGSVFSDGLRQKFSIYQLDMCMAVLAELGKTFWAADMTYNIFSEAKRKIKSKFDRQPPVPRPSSITTPGSNHCISTLTQTPAPPVTAMGNPSSHGQTSSSMDLSEPDLSALLGGELFLSADRCLFPDTIFEPGGEWDFDSNTFMSPSGFMNFENTNEVAFMSHET
ncbi:hypothetical protein AYO20_02804 [Fonsecaea nubica]|uniref:Xylanolytic transcriptional activator regulatory domain-containing protein n=1 Tax=Fonsecaea nubica TaxID=856822 RepID=A0A178D9R2_9EURO|nr:hypothetical protein AYO20_02804 [Fonsecaea nubica]OAL37971.1 hypothetical protein AYO20_02804 [Fonsecaea nubica]